MTSLAKIFTPDTPLGSREITQDGVKRFKDGLLSFANELARLTFIGQSRNPPFDYCNSGIASLFGKYIELRMAAWHVGVDFSDYDTAIETICEALNEIVNGNDPDGQWLAELTHKFKGLSAEQIAHRLINS